MPTNPRKPKPKRTATIKNRNKGEKQQVSALNAENYNDDAQALAVLNDWAKSNGWKNWKDFTHGSGLKYVHEYVQPDLVKFAISATRARFIAFKQKEQDFSEGGRYIPDCHTCKKRNYAQALASGVKEGQEKMEKSDWIKKYKARVVEETKQKMRSSGGEVAKARAEGVKEGRDKGFDEGRTYRDGQKSKNCFYVKESIINKARAEGVKEGILIAQSTKPEDFCSHPEKEARADERRLIFADLEARIKKYRKIHAGEGWLSAMLLEMKSVWKVE